MKLMTWSAMALMGALAWGFSGGPTLEEDNPLRPIPASPLGINQKLSELPEPPTPEKVRLGRWLFYDTRLSADDTISCATCHRPEHAFSEPTAVSAGIRGQKGTRKAPTFINLAFSLQPHFFWDGRAKSLEEQALGPITNPIEMGMKSHDVAIEKLSKVEGYKKYFKAAFGDAKITNDRVAQAIADFERTRLSGNSDWDKWRAGDESAVDDSVKRGHTLFFGKARCVTCHVGDNFTDGGFHNLGVGFDAKTKKFADVGRSAISGKKEDTGAFKTPGLRDLTFRAPYLHDGSAQTLEEVMELYNRGGNKNPHLDPLMQPLKLTSTEINDVIEFMKALDGEGWQEKAPSVFP